MYRFDRFRNQDFTVKNIENFNKFTNFSINKKKH